MFELDVEHPEKNRPARRTQGTRSGTADTANRTGSTSFQVAISWLSLSLYGIGRARDESDIDTRATGNAYPQLMLVLHYSATPDRRAERRGTRGGTANY